MSETINVPRGTARPLRLPRVVLMDDRGAYVWSGTLTQFIRDNRMDREARASLINDLRPRGNILEPAFVGGGAGVEFAVLLEAPR